MRTARSQDQRQQMLRQAFHPGVWWGRDDGLTSQSGSPGRFRVFWSVFFVQAVSFLSVIPFCGVFPLPAHWLSLKLDFFLLRAFTYPPPDGSFCYLTYTSVIVIKAGRLQDHWDQTESKIWWRTREQPRFVPNGPFKSILVNYAWAGLELSAQLICLQLWKLRPK